jgi:AcrR family transcriptional regulator
VPRLWNATIESHRQQVREAILESAMALVSERGLLAVTMSQIAADAGISRATLYKYFPDVEAVLLAWHERHVHHHLAALADVPDQHQGPAERLAAVLRAYAQMSYHRARHSTEELGVLLHRGDAVSAAEKELHDLMRDLVADAAAAGTVRDDADPDELAAFCLHALSAASGMTTQEAAERLADVTMDALRPRGATAP